MRGVEMMPCYQILLLVHICYYLLADGPSHPSTSSVELSGPELIVQTCASKITPFTYINLDVPGI